MTAARYRLFEVVGLELEYAIVDDQLRPRTLLEPAFRRLAGRPTSQIELGDVGFSNELAAHVFEIKTLEPTADLAEAEEKLVDGLRHFARTLHDEFGGRLLPTGMHPFMSPADTSLWQRAGRRIYETYDGIFDIRGHGWLNVQASHVNLPFGSEAETVAMHNATACLLPYLPALAASSPIYEGRLGPSVDNRLEFYKRNQTRIPSITARVIPEFIDSYADYRRRVLHPIYAALEHVPGGSRLRHEWVNSRGAIMRFSRSALELKLIDIQECVKADIAIAVFVRSAVRHLTKRLHSGSMTLPDHAMLVADLDAAIQHGSQAQVEARHLRPSASGDATAARSVLGLLLEGAYAETPPEERPYFELLEDRVRRGNLSERIAHQVRRRQRRREAAEREIVREVYRELMDCLEHNTPWGG